MRRTLVLAAGLAGALSAAQFPSYSQQYLQRLGGAVDALGEVVADFDASAAALDMTRSEALEQMQGTSFVSARQQDMKRTFARHNALQRDLQALEGQGPFMRAYRAAHLNDPEIAQGAWAAFQPALPLSFASGLFALAGFVCGAGVMRLLCSFRPRRRPEPAMSA